MRIKHWQGYGAISAKKISDRAIPGTADRLLIVKVQGNHEYGIDCSHYGGIWHDTVYNWLLKRGERFVPKGDMDSVRCIKDIKVENLFDMEAKEDVAMYRITYTPSAPKAQHPPIFKLKGEWP